jgi:DNA (cytosine-5)-methyltransferase 1
MRFIDLFAGLGGFHKALHDLGHECVYASEIDPVLQLTYKQNWGLTPVGDIRKIVETDIDSIPPHDILCAGFPCQPFSKAGKQLGRNDTERGTLFDEIVKILEHREPDYFILENVPFIAKHDNEETWKYMESRFEELGYEVDHKNYSPHHFGVPQHRLRIFIVGSRKGLDHFQFSSIDEQTTLLTDIKHFIDDKPKNYKALPKVNQNVLKLWQEFLSAIPEKTKVPGFPIWGMEFGATYPYEWPYPYKMSAERLGEFKGNFGISLKGMTKKEQLANLPSYARTTKKFPSWKKTLDRLQPTVLQGQ